MSKVNYGLDGIRQRDYRVWINFEDMKEADGELDFITAVDAMGNLYEFIHENPIDYKEIFVALNALKGCMYHVGEMRADSVELSVEDGDSVEGNEVGKIVLGKTGKFATELINSTPDIISWLALRDTKECIIMLEELNPTRFKSYDGAMLETHEIILIGNVPAMAEGLTDNVGVAFNYADKVVGKDIVISTLSVEKTVPTASAFRQIMDVNYEEPAGAPSIATLEIVTDNINIEWYWNGEEGIADGYRLEFSFNESFEDLHHSHDIDNINEVEYFFPVPSQTGTLYARMSTIKNGVQKSVYSNVEEIEII